MDDVQVFYQATPNPDSMKFMVDRVIASETLQFSEGDKAARSPLAAKILGFPWALGVLIGPNFVTVTKQNWVEWQILADPLSDLIREHIVAKLPVLVDSTESSGPASDDDQPGDSPIVLQIKKILREEIKPAVANDGGDISFSRYENGRVFLSMHGACSGCPSSALTLKEGIETRLKEAVPEIVEVVAT